MQTVAVGKCLSVREEACGVRASLRMNTAAVEQLDNYFDFDEFETTDDCAPEISVDTLNVAYRTDLVNKFDLIHNQAEWPHGWTTHAWPQRRHSLKDFGVEGGLVISCAQGHWDDPN